MLKKAFCFLAVIFLFANLYSQDSIHITAKLSADNSILTVQQKMVYQNNLKIPIQKIKLLNWIAAYKNKGTVLAKRKLEDRKNDLYFAKENRLGSLLELNINKKAFSGNLDSENLYVDLDTPLEPSEQKTFMLEYQLKLPDLAFTGFGTSASKTVLKYFFLVPDSFETDKQTEKFYADIGETQCGGCFWTITINSDQQFNLRSNLRKLGANTFSGRLNTDPEVGLYNFNYPVFSLKVDEQPIQVELGYDASQDERASLEFYLPLQLKYIKDRIGFLPEKLFIDEKFKKSEDFFGNDDIKFWKFRYSLFTEQQNIDLDYFSIISKKVLETSFITNKNTDHWLINGLKNYLEIEYLKKFYQDSKLLGILPDQFKFLGMKPLKWTNASKMKLTERYGIAYQYIMTQNLDQKISEDFSKLSNLNQLVISGFETGSLISFIAEKMGSSNFDSFVQNYFVPKQNERVSPNDFLDKLQAASSNSSVFMQNYIQHKKRINFDLKYFKKLDQVYDITISKNTASPIPFKIKTTDKGENPKIFWYDSKPEKNAQSYQLPQNNANKIVLNDNYAFPESNFRDNYLYTKGFFANQKKMKLKLVKDIPNPEFNEIYLNPRINFNVYDKVLLGLNFRNLALFDRKFVYSITPYFSTGTSKFTGSGSLSYSIQPAESFFRSWNFGVSGSYFHYDYDLAYRKFTASTGMNFTKNPRSSESRYLGASWNHFENDLSPQMVAANKYDKYNIWNIGYGYSDSKLIHEKYFSTNLQLMEDFQKISLEAFYRWEYAKNKKISFRVFGGYFLSNTTRNTYFNYGISRVSNYSFSYGLLGQSATSGILAQQFVLADGGFKSFFGQTAGQWIGSANVDSHIWKWFSIYADAGVFKNQNVSPKFIWDSGIKVKIIPDFFELYFPVQSSLGFEPGFKDYGYRIRYTLVINLNSAINYFRRGWF